MWDILTDALVRHYWLQKWFEGTKGIVEYLAEWVREYSTPEDAKAVGICFVIIVCLMLGFKGAQFLRKPLKGETLLDALRNDNHQDKED